MTDQLPWPPTKEDLERLYLEQGLSAAKIARAYGLRYTSQKTAESTILYHLKRNGIVRRDRAEHVRKITEEIVEQWIERYNAGESLTQIASQEVSPVTVWNHLRSRGVTLRDKIEAQIKAVTKYQKKPFSGDLVEKAYLLGLSWGDLHISKHGRAVRVKTATTHPAMAELVKRCFEKYAHVAVFPVVSSMAGYEWAVQADLDDTFEFMLQKYGEVPKWVLETKELFYSFVAGLFDAEGSIWLHETTSFDFEISITNGDLRLLEAVGKKLFEYGFDVRIMKNREGNLWRIQMWNPYYVAEFLRVIPFRHREKETKASLALKIQASRGESYENLAKEWDSLREAIRLERDEFVEKSRLTLAKSHNGNRTIG